MNLPQRADVLIIGAGTAGAAAAAACAQRHMKVVCADARRLEDSGARWVNGVPEWCFEEAGVPAPKGTELRGQGAPFHMIAGQGPSRVVLRGHGLMDVDMRHLIARLQEYARSAGATLVGGQRVRGIQRLDGGGARVQVGDKVVEARWVIDASGLGGAGLVDRPKPAAADLCAAAQYVHHVDDVQAATAWFRSHQVAPGETLCFTGIAGGYSILNVQLHGERVAMLTGSIPAAGHPAGQVILDRFVAEQPWVGTRLFGGARAIPLRLPYDRLDDGAVALLGDAACQVFAMHGSGIGAGLIAARLLANSLADGRGTWGYNVDWQRRFGGLFAASCLFARFSRSLSVAQMGVLMDAGLMREGIAVAGLEQKPVKPAPSDLPGLVGGALKAPRVVAGVLPVLGKMGAVQTLYQMYPRELGGLARWRRMRVRLARE